MFKKRMLGVVLVVAVVGAGVAASGLGSAGRVEAERTDCPGIVTCPLTGEPVCRDLCPLGVGLVGTESRQASCCPAPG